MVVTPNTNITLLKTPFELDSLNQLTFSSKQAQYNYFNSLPKLSYDNATYQRKDGVIAFPTSPTGVTYEDLIQYNYCMYQNESYDDKWFYAYITKVTYDNNGMSYIEIETDVFQTWQFDITYKPSFIDREMLAKSDDVVGANTIPENLETGDYIIQKQEVMSLDKVIGETSYSTFYCVAVSENLFDNSVSLIQSYFKVPSGLIYIIPQSKQDLARLIWYYNNQGKAEAIHSLFVIPAGLFHSSPAITWQTYNVPILGLPISYTYYPDYNGAVTMGQLDLDLPTSIQGYVPKNKKLLTFPYTFLRGDNGCGNFCIYKIENFQAQDRENNQVRFYAKGTISPGCDGKITAVGYNFYNILDMSNYSDTFNVAKFPIGGWITDTYTNWLTQNGVNMKMNVLEKSLSNGLNAGIFGASLFGGAGGLVTGTAGLIGGAFEGTLGNMVQSEEHKFMPDQANGNVNSSNIMFAETGNFPIFQVLTIKREFAQSIDDFFSMYGYKTNRVKLPNINNRSNWNYIKTKGCNIIGDIPQADLQKIKNLFDNGFTLWHNPNTFLDYSQANN